MAVTFLAVMPIGEQAVMELLERMEVTVLALQQVIVQCLPLSLKNFIYLMIKQLQEVQVAAAVAAVAVAVVIAELIVFVVVVTPVMAELVELEEAAVMVELVVSVEVLVHLSLWSTVPIVSYLTTI